MPLSIKAAGLSDATILAQLGAITFYETFRPYNTEEDMQAYITKTYAEPLISQNLQHPDIQYALVYDHAEAIGYIKLLLNGQHPALSGRSIELEKIYVRQSALGSGAGKLLMDYAITLTFYFWGFGKKIKEQYGFTKKQDLQYSLNGLLL
jgi:GNAT superfamily N-acetyltransferase